MELIKDYKIVSGIDKIENIKVKIYYGFNKELLENFPDKFEEGKDEMLFMFVPNDENFSWFSTNVNINPYIVVMKSELKNDVVKMDIFERIVDKMFEQQNEALEVHFSRIENNENDLSNEN